jgi:hypothetical protein
MIISPFAHADVFTGTVHFGKLSINHISNNTVDNN